MFMFYGYTVVLGKKQRFLYPRFIWKKKLHYLFTQTSRVALYESVNDDENWVNGIRYDVIFTLKYFLEPSETNYNLLSFWKLHLFQ